MPLLGATVEVVPNGVEPGPEPSPLRASPPVLGFHGVFDSQANVDAARTWSSDIWPRVRADRPGARCCLSAAGRRERYADLVGKGVELRADVPDIRLGAVGDDGARRLDDVGRGHQEQGARGDGRRPSGSGVAMPAREGSARVPGCSSPTTPRLPRPRIVATAARPGDAARRQERRLERAFVADFSWDGERAQHRAALDASGGSDVAMKIEVVT